MDPALKVLALFLGRSYLDAHDRNPDAFPVPHKDSAPVTQESVKALVELHTKIDDADFGNDTQAAKRASLHWLILFEQMKFKVNMQSAALPPGWDALRTISHERLETVNHEEIEDFIAWRDKVHEGKEGDAKDYFPLLHIQSHASWNESTAGSTGSDTGTANSAPPSTQSGH